MERLPAPVAPEGPLEIKRQGRIGWALRGGRTQDRRSRKAIAGGIAAFERPKPAAGERRPVRRDRPKSTATKIAAAPATRSRTEITVEMTWPLLCEPSPERFMGNRFRPRISAAHRSKTIPQTWSRREYQGSVPPEPTVVSWLAGEGVPTACEATPVISGAGRPGRPLSLSPTRESSSLLSPEGTAGKAASPVVPTSSVIARSS